MVQVAGSNTGRPPCLPKSSDSLVLDTSPRHGKDQLRPCMEYSRYSSISQLFTLPGRSSVSAASWQIYTALRGQTSGATLSAMNPGQRLQQAGRALPNDCKLKTPLLTRDQGRLHHFDGGVAAIVFLHVTPAMKDHYREQLCRRRIVTSNNLGTTTNEQDVKWVPAANPLLTQTMVKMLSNVTISATEYQEVCLRGGQAMYRLPLRRNGSIYSPIRGRGGIVVRLHAFHLGEQGSILGRVTPGSSHVGIMPDDATGRWVFSGFSRFTRPCIPTLLHTRSTSPSLALKNSIWLCRPSGRNVIHDSSRTFVSSWRCLAVVFVHQSRPSTSTNKHERVCGQRRPLHPCRIIEHRRTVRNQPSELILLHSPRRLQLNPPFPPATARYITASREEVATLRYTSPPRHPAPYSAGTLHRSACVFGNPSTLSDVETSRRPLACWSPENSSFNILYTNCTCSERGPHLNDFTPANSSIHGELPRSRTLNSQRKHMPSMRPTQTDYEGLLSEKTTKDNTDNHPSIPRNPPSSGIVHRDSHMRKSVSDPTGNRTQFV
ncbi:hypothetical protein PR048_009045 [Dryococelus australis]|uniref:Uncharacterized protein n=1 Tax=Dryococelus australis TaxID=614101 RepID=A0ABQ9HYT8_9NEOP|nr:hypothetical protein PR048_009045 [Dryococelus australis]